VPVESQATQFFRCPQAQALPPNSVIDNFQANWIGKTRMNHSAASKASLDSKSLSTQTRQTPAVVSEGNSIKR